MRASDWSRRGQQVLARAQVAVRPGPHVPAGLGGDDQLVAVGAQVLGEDAAEVLLRRAVGRPVVVGQVELGDAQVEGAPHERALVGEGHVVAEVVPEPQRDLRQLQATLAGVTVADDVVAARVGHVGRPLRG